DAAFYTRVAERLRHKDRCRSSWDYERVVLEAFPAIHKVKCVPHANGSSWLTPGHVLLVVVPALHNRNAVDPLQPKVDANTISQVTTHVRARCAEQIELHVKNPRYQKIRLDFKVRFRTGFEFNYYRRELEQELIRLLSPWAFESVRDISFGGRVAKSVLLDFVEERDYVDFVTDFRMYSFAGDTADLTDIAEAQPATPDTILVSDRAHSITHVA
ncbi:MAG TPA: baseplate J/gp47 family protein, partial [Longimicrobiales bacterium]|nr:baseplate J/gp47 family protein [Longimicrobiales bacterium]